MKIVYMLKTLKKLNIFKVNIGITNYVLFNVLFNVLFII